MLSLFIGLLFVIYAITTGISVIGRLTGTKEKFQEGMSAIKMIFAGIGNINQGELNAIIAFHLSIFIVLATIFNLAWPPLSVFIWAIIHAICLYKAHNSQVSVAKFINGELEIIDFEETRTSWFEIINGFIISSGLLFTLLKVAG